MKYKAFVDNKIRAVTMNDGNSYNKAPSVWKYYIIIYIIKMIIKMYVYPVEINNLALKSIGRPMRTFNYLIKNS